VNRILVVDEETALRETVAAVLSRDGHAVNTAQAGAEALRLLDHHRSDLIVSDLRMPDSTGRISTMPSIRLLLEKPFSLNALHEMVERQLATR
jgi:CheY-like chemotaxis protein